MKSFIDIFDYILLIIILGLMLSFLFSTAGSMLNEESYGFAPGGDKTMKLATGVLLLTELTEDDKLTASEIMLMTKVAEADTLKYDFTLPGILDNTREYTLAFDYETQKWKFS